MPDDVDTTESTETVAPQSTTQSSTVSTQSVQTPRASDPELRISRLQSELDKAKAQANASAVEKATLLNQVDTHKIEKESVMAIAAEATRTAIAKAEMLEKENATLKAEAFRARFLIAHPDLMPFASLVPMTTDEDQLNNVATEITKARERDLETLRATVRSGGSIPAATPSHTTGTVTSADIDAQLKAARNNPKEFERLLSVFAKQSAT